MLQSKTCVALLFLLPALGGTIAPAPVARAGERQARPRPEIRPDQALVYFIRTSHFSLAGRTLFVFADDRFLGVLDNSSYGFAYVDPGRRLFWTNWSRLRKGMQLIPGQAYYLDLWEHISLLDEEEGEARLDQVKSHRTPSESESARAADLVNERYARAQQRDARARALESEGPAAAASASEDMSDRLKLPAHTPISLELMENLSSHFSRKGDTVWFRVAEDASADGRVAVGAGTPVRGTILEVKRARDGGVPGYIDVSIPAVEAVDGTLLPVAGRFTSTGSDRENTYAAIAAADWLLDIEDEGDYRGGEAHRLTGHRVEAFTLNDSWVELLDLTQVEKAESASKAFPGADQVVKAEADRRVKLSPREPRIMRDVPFTLYTEQQPSKVMVIAVGDWTLPEPVLAEHVAHTDGGWSCVFDGWNLARHLRARPGVTRNEVTLYGTLSDGTTFSSVASVKIAVKS